MLYQLFGNDNLYELTWITFQILEVFELLPTLQKVLDFRPCTFLLKPSQKGVLQLKDYTPKESSLNHFSVHRDVWSCSSLLRFTQKLIL